MCSVPYLNVTYISGVHSCTNLGFSLLQSTGYTYFAVLKLPDSTVYTNSANAKGNSIFAEVNSESMVAIRRTHASSYKTRKTDWFSSDGGVQR